MASSLANVFLLLVLLAKSHLKSCSSIGVRAWITLPFPSKQPLRAPSRHWNVRPTTELATEAVTLEESPEVPPVPQPLNPAVYTIEPSKTVAIFSLVKQMEQQQGIKVTSLCVGEPDFPPPPSVQEAIAEIFAANGGTDAKQRINAATKYTAVSGMLSLRQAIADDLRKRKQTEYNPNTEILVSNGAKQSVYQAIWAMAGPGDVVLIPSPYWPSYPEQVRLTGATPVIVPTPLENGFRVTPSLLQETLDLYPQTKVLVLCNPSNPTGTVYSSEELQDLCGVLYKYPNVTVIADEIYERLTYTDGPVHTSMASLPHMRHRTITINGFSKSHAMTGLRIGYSCAPAHITTAMTTLQSQLTSCAGALSQLAAVAALQKTPDAWMDQVIRTMQDKRDYVLSQLSTIPGVTVPLKYPPTGAFYVLPDIRPYCQCTDDASEEDYDDVSFCVQLLEQEQLALVPGSSFGLPGTVRLSYATSMEELQEAMDKFTHFLSKERERLKL
jgi:aspartate/methionine/tyrosine aminotransferase